MASSPVLRRTALPLVTAASATLLWSVQSKKQEDLYRWYDATATTTQCEATTAAAQALGVEKANLLDRVSNSWMQTSSSTTGTTTLGGSMRPKGVMGTFYKLFPFRQLWKPAVDYPMWDANWDGRGDCKVDEAVILNGDAIQGKVRHFILIPHGQYQALDLDEEDDVDNDDDDEATANDTACLTPLGRQQATATGDRLAQLLANHASSKNITLRVSDLQQAKETAQIVAQHLPSTAKLSAADPLLNEGR